MPAHALKALQVALVVGTILCLINDSFSGGAAARMLLNYFVPFCVSLYSRMALTREKQSATKD